jgi:hypothetical protein
VHVLATQRRSAAGYYRVETGDVMGVVRALQEIEATLLTSKKREMKFSAEEPRSSLGNNAAGDSVVH